MTSNANPNGRETILGAPNFPSKFPNPSCSLMLAFMFSKNPGLEPFPSNDSAAPATAYNGRLKALKPFVIIPSGGGGTSSPVLSGPYHCSLSFWFLSCSIVFRTPANFASKLKSVPVGDVSGT